MMGISSWVPISYELEVLIRKDQYQCAHCKLVYNKVDDEEWNDEKSKAEHDARFPFQSLETAVIVCDDCFQMMNAWWDGIVAKN